MTVLREDEWPRPKLIPLRKGKKAARWPPPVEAPDPRRAEEGRPFVAPGAGQDEDENELLEADGSQEVE